MHKSVLLATLAAGGALGQTTVDLFLPVAKPTGLKWAASVVNADSCTTTYALVCQSGSYSELSTVATCNPTETGYATYGPNSYEASTHTTIDGAKATIVETCSLAGTTSAVCYASVSISVSGTSTATATSATLTGTEFGYAQIPVTAGASKLQGQAACTNSGNAAAPTGIVDIYKVLIVPGAALLAGALA